MSHELHQDANGKVSMAYVGVTPWHGLGQLLTPDAPLSVWLTEAGMDFGIEATPVMGMHGETRISMPEKMMLFRSDTLLPLAVVSNKYKVVQPREILYAQEELIDKLGFKMETAGVMFAGKRFWSLSRTGNAGNVVDGDEMDQYLMLVTACDGSLATTAKFTAIRVVCNNTLTMSLNETGRTTVKIPHSSTFDMKKVKQELGLGGESWDMFLTDMRELASHTMTNGEAIAFLKHLVGDPTKSLEDQTRGAAGLMQDIHALWKADSIGHDLVGQTKWGMLNAVTEYVDHHTGHKTVDSRMSNAWMGEGDKLKSQALDLLHIL